MIKVYLDTNMLEDKGKDKNIIISDRILSTKFYDLKSFIQNNNQLKENVKLVLTKVSIDEIKQHIKETYGYISNLTTDYKESVYGLIKNFDKKQNIILPETLENLLKRFNEEIENLTKQYNYIVIEKHDNSLDKIYKMAITKEKPFYSKKAPKTDAGLKDALILKTIEDNNDGSDIVLCSNDGDYGDYNVYITNDIDETEKYIENKISKISEQEKIKQFINQDYIKQRIIDELCPKETPQIKLIKYYSPEDLELDGCNVVELQLILESKVINAVYNVDIAANEIELVESQEIL